MHRRRRRSHPVSADGSRRGGTTMRLSSGPASFPASHTDCRPRGSATRRSARPLHPHDADRRPHRTGLGRSAPAHVSARHADRGAPAGSAHPTRRAVPRRPRPLRRRPAGRAHPGGARARPHRQPVGVLRDAPRPPQARVHPDLHLELQPAADRRRPRGRRPRRPHRADLRADGARPRARRRPQPRRPDRPLLRAAPGRRPPGRVAGDARDAAPRLDPRARDAHAAGPPAAAGLPGPAAARGAGARLHAPG